jgi:hypothetical protein
MTDTTSADTGAVSARALRRFTGGRGSCGGKCFTSRPFCAIRRDMRRLAVASGLSRAIDRQSR